MNAAELYSFIYKWVSPLVAPLPVVRLYQSTAKPAKSYFGIEDDVAWKPFGRPTNYAGPVDRIVYDYTVSPVLWEVEGFGDSLREVAESLGTLATKQMFSDAGIGILSVGPISTLPWRSLETEYVRQHRMELHLSLARDRTDPSIVPIETVTLINQVGGTP